MKWRNSCAIFALDKSKGGKKEMNSAKILLTLLVLNALLINPAFSETAKSDDGDYAIPAFSDFQLLGTQSIPQEKLAADALGHELNPLADVQRFKWFDLNHDSQLNDFDIKNFQAIIENLHGEKLTGLQLSIRFRGEQKNQKDSFPLLYDLDRDGMFTSFDVDYFTDLINKLDEGASRGSELIQRFRLQIFPRNYNNRT